MHCNQHRSEGCLRGEKSSQTGGWEEMELRKDPPPTDTGDASMDKEELGNTTGNVKDGYEGSVRPTTRSVRRT